MTQQLNLKLVRRQTPADAFRSAMTPKVIFHLFYTVFGFLITAVLWVAGFLSLHTGDGLALPLFSVATGSAVLWGLCYGAWAASLKLPWLALASATTVALILAGVCALCTLPFDLPLLAVLFGGAAAVSGLRLGLQFLRKH